MPFEVYSAHVFNNSFGRVYMSMMSLVYQFYRFTCFLGSMLDTSDRPPNLLFLCQYIVVVIVMWNTFDNECPITLGTIYFCADHAI